MIQSDLLEYEVRGEGEPVLFVHGSHIADAFLPLTREPILAERFRLIRYHRRGFAGSASHAGPFRIEQQAHDALLLVQKLEIDRLHIVGHSYGAVTAIQLALQAPQAVHSLVLLEAAVTTTDESTAKELSEMFSPLVELYRSGDSRGAMDAFLCVACGPDWRSEVAETVPGGAEQAERDAATFFEVEVPALQAWNFNEAEASRIFQPVLYIIGSESGPFFERPKQRFLSAVPHAEEVVLPGLNHLLHMRSPSLVARPIADFLSRHPL